MFIGLTMLLSNELEKKEFDFGCVFLVYLLGMCWEIAFWAVVYKYVI